MIYFGIFKKKVEYKQLKQQMVEEQGFVCCYCNCRISIIRETSEHILPIKSHKQLLAEYKNILVSCNHSRTQRQSDNTYPIHCDASKDNQILPFSPLDDKSDYVFEYNITDGSITSIDIDGIAVIRILQLDCSKLRDNRLAALSILYDSSNNLLPEEDLELIFKEIDKKDSSGMYHPYYKCIEYCTFSIL